MPTRSPRVAHLPRAAVAVAMTLSAVAMTLSAAGCARSAGAPAGRIGVVVAFYPLQFLAERIGGDRVAVTDLVKPGAEPHDLELKPSQVAAIADATVVLYLRGFQPAVDDAVDQQAATRAFDVATVAPLRPAPPGGESGVETTMAGQAHDPHVWLDPVRFAAIGDRVATRLAAADPAHATEFASRAAALHADLTAVDAEYAKGLAHCARHEIVTSHAAFGYLAARYGLVQIPVSGLSPDAEASPGRLAEVADLARRSGATTVFFETLVSPKVAQALAAEVGAKAEVLDPIEGLQPGAADDYLSVMRRNLVTLTTALGCT